MAKSSTIANLLVYVGADTGSFFRGMGQVASKSAAVAGDIAKFGAVAGLAMAAVGVAAVKMAGDFQDQMADVSTLIDGGPAEAMQRFGADVKRVSVLTGKGLDDMSNGLYETISAWGDSADAVKQFEIAAKAAVGGKAETIDAVKMLSVVTKGYGDTSAAAVQKVADLAFQTANLGQTTFPELANEMGKVVPLAATLTVKQEELFGAMATLTGVTGGTAEVATQLRATMQALINPTSQMASKLSKLGFTNGKTMIETMGLQGTLDLLAKSTGGNTAELAKMFGSVEALNAVLALTGNQSADFTTKTLAMTQAAGAADEAFRKKSETFNAMVARLKQMGTVAMVELGEKFLPVLMQLGEWVMANMPTVQAVMEQAFNLVGAAVNWLGGIFTWFMGNILTPFVAAWNGNADAMATPIGRLAGIVKTVWEAVAGYFTTFKTNVWEPFVRGWNGGNTEMGSTSERIYALIGSVFRGVWEVVKSVLDALSLIWNEWGDEIMKVVGIAFETVLRVIDSALKIVDGVIKFFIALFKGDWEGMWQAIVQIWNGLWSGIVAIVEGVWGILSTVLGGLLGSLSKWFIDLVTDAYNWGANMMQGFYDGITGWFGRIADSVSGFVSRMTDQVKSVLGIHSPSRVFADIGANIGAGLAIGIEGSADVVNRALADVAGASMSVTMSSVGSQADRTSTRDGGNAGPVTIPISLDGTLIAEYVVDLATGQVKQVTRAMGKALVPRLG